MSGQHRTYYQQARGRREAGKANAWCALWRADQGQGKHCGYARMSAGAMVIASMRLCTPAGQAIRISSTTFSPSKIYTLLHEGIYLAL
jgi:hypothetical protein